MFYKDNWLSWSYDNGPTNGPKLTPRAEFKLHFKNVVTRPVKSYHEELLSNAQLIRDTFTGGLDLLFSGGIDSEVILRVYHELKIPINVFVFKYENNYNLLEYNHAIEVCNELNVTPTIIDFNLEKFFENDAYDIWSKCYAYSSGWLPHMKMTEYLDGLPIIGSGEPYWRHTSRDLSNPEPWVFDIEEVSHHWAVYHKTINRPCITDWYEYSPEITLSHLQLPYVQDLVNNRVSGKLSTVSSKAFIHQAYWPTIKDRPKMIGFEGTAHKKGEQPVPPFMLEFSKTYIREKVDAKFYTFTQDEIVKLFGSQ